MSIASAPPPRGARHDEDPRTDLRSAQPAADPVGRRDRGGAASGRTARLRGRGGLHALGVAAGALLVLVVLTGVIGLPSVGDLLTDLSDTLGAWTYLLVPVLAFLETAAFLGLVVPGETAVLVGGVVAERGEVSLPVLVVLVWAAAVAGDLASFLLGRRLGGGFLRRHAGRLRVKHEHIDRAEQLMDRHGGKAIVIGRFVGVLRAFTPFVAGASGMTLRRFVPYSTVAALAWATVFAGAGFVFSTSISTVGLVVTAITVTAVLVAGLVLWVRRSRQRRARRDAPAAPVGPSRPRPFGRRPRTTVPVASWRRRAARSTPVSAPDRPSLPVAVGRWRFELALFAVAYLVYLVSRWLFAAARLVAHRFPPPPARQAIRRLRGTPPRPARPALPLADL